MADTALKETPAVETEAEAVTLTKEKYAMFERQFSSQVEKPARPQISKEILKIKRPDLEAEAYEGLYNIWYHSRPGLDKEKDAVVKNVFRCDPARDVGRTQGDKLRPPIRFCVFFARGQCWRGEACEYLHRIPETHHQRHIPETKDCFGRPRFGWNPSSAARLKECRTLRVSNLPSHEPGLDKRLRYHFGLFGQFVQFNYISSMNVAFIEYKTRAQAEFAKEALTGNNVGGSEVLQIRFAIEPSKKTPIHEQNAAEELRADIMAAMPTKALEAPVEALEEAGNAVTKEVLKAHIAETGAVKQTRRRVKRVTDVF
ncbi:RNA recognition motif [Carpediemonas membranifera]|uniref:RNA recognition motif n=1 Tax=Carpediemonas membranifera TaxID=201153 RepID=A0A8J6E2C9_9EUKA|nr:RNA recognition motif [Carpediemonas membranifera]|eukprot:KAG9394538.1 RNA recognition motif [Carpediemonas membranifera]